MALPRFAVTYDYRCPFARNAHEHLVTALEGGASWDVDFLPFSLSQVHVEEGQPPVWDDPDKAADLLAIEASLAVRHHQPEHFLAVHRALFAVRHDQGKDLRDQAVVRDALQTAGADAEAALAVVAGGEPHRLFRAAHEAAVAGHQVFGVPTFVVGDRAVFVRLMTRPNGDAAAARALIEQVVGLAIGHPEINELKATTIDR